MKKGRIYRFVTHLSPKKNRHPTPSWSIYFF
nr:MAG TPA: hypothetical protein [Caudoviricetes sp.]